MTQAGIRQDIRKMYIPREIGSDKAFIPQQSNPNMVESRTTQELTLCGVGGG